jgi:hypothetical protein
VQGLKPLWVPGAFQLWAAMGQGESTCIAPAESRDMKRCFRTPCTIFPTA